MTPNNNLFHSIGIVLLAAAACTTPNPVFRPPHSDAGPVANAPGDAAPDASPDMPGSGSPPALCTANQALRCASNALVRCNSAGTGEITEACVLSCNSSELRCLDVAPSNGLAAFLDQARGQPDLNLGESAVINTDNGDVTVGDAVVRVKSDALVQSGAPTIRVFVVRSLVAKRVVVTGSNALAIVSDGDIKIDDEFRVSAPFEVPGPGAFNGGSCNGGAATNSGYSTGGAGGGGFGLAGGAGGAGTSGSPRVGGSAGGAATGNESLIPLRGGCDGGSRGGLQRRAGGGGGAMQLVSRTQIVVNGTIAANGSSSLGGGGSGGGILLEAPTVRVAGRVVANGGAGGGSIVGQDPVNDAVSAIGGDEYVTNVAYGRGGNGGSRDHAATNGSDVTAADDESGFKTATGGSGGGGVGRIRINTAPGGYPNTGVFSPHATAGAVGTR